MITLVEFITIGLGIVSVVIVPSMVLAIRSAVKWARLESKVEEVVTDLKELVDNKDTTHREIVNNMEKMYTALINRMSSEREATDKRLRYLEERYWGNAIRDPKERG